MQIGVPVVGLLWIFWIISDVAMMFHMREGEFV